MKMLDIEKFLNRIQSKKGAMDLTKKLLDFVELNGQNDFLDLGCGSGIVTRYLAKEYGGSVTGIDIDPQQIELAKKDASGINNIRYYGADATNLPFSDRAFDIVLSFGVLHHIENWLDALKEIRRVLKNGGYFLYADIIYPEKITSMDRSSSMSFGLVTIDIDELNSFLEKFGFTTIHSQRKKRLVCKNYEAVYRRN
ncbi:MAG: methyltransferase domain-containing protein [Dehalococcoidales bacterium]|nr:methyltransferase domain-containing protein [Dehalococcoidales bacterium]